MCCSVLGYGAKERIQMSLRTGTSLVIEEHQALEEAAQVMRNSQPWANPQEMTALCLND